MKSLKKSGLVLILATLLFNCAPKPSINSSYKENITINTEKTVIIDEKDYNKDSINKIPSDLPKVPDASEIEKLTKKSGFSTKAVYGNLSANFSTIGLLYTPNLIQYLWGTNFENGRLYKINLKSNSNQPVYGFLYKKINGNWTADRWISSNDKIVFQGGKINFSEIYVYRFCSEKATSGSASIEEVKFPNPLSIKYQYQGSLKNNYFSKDSADSSCAPTSAAMLVNYHNKMKKSSLADEARLLYELSKTNTVVGTDHANLEKSLRNDYGFTVDYIIGQNNIWSSIVSEINAGRPVIFRSWGFPAGTVKHYILVTGYNASNKTIIANDPWFGAGYVWNFNKISSNTPGLITVK